MELQYLGLLLTILFLVGYKFSCNIKNAEILLVVFMIILMGGNTENPDYINYEWAYNNEFTSHSHESIYYFCIKLGNLLGLDYSNFKFILSTICLIFLYLLFRKYQKNNICLISLYFIYPFFIDIVQIRNFVAMIIVLASFMVLNSSMKLKKLYFLILILIASGFQFLAICYLPLLFIEKIKNNRFLKIFMAFSSVIFIGVSLSQINSYHFVTFISQFLFGFDDRLTIYADSINTNYGHLYSILKSIISIAFLYYWYAKSHKCIPNDKYLWIKFALWVNIFCLLFLPFASINGIFDRIYRNLYLMNYLAFGIYYNYQSVPKGRGNINFIKYSYILFILTISAYEIFLPHWDDIIIPIFENNIFW